MTLRIDPELCAFLESGVATVVGTRDAALVPEIARGWGVRVLPDRVGVEMCIGLPSGGRTLGNLGENGRVAVTCVRPSDYKQVQLKGGAVETGEPTAEDREWVARHRELFRQQVAQVGIAPHLCDAFWAHDDPAALVKVRFLVEEAFDQTPGPEAGRRL